MTEELLQALPAIWITTGAIGASIYDDKTCSNGDCPSMSRKYLKESLLVLGGPITLLTVGISKSRQYLARPKEDTIETRTH